MATVTNNIVTKGLTGKVGNLVFRRRGDKTTAYVLSPRKVPQSKKQIEVQTEFREAVVRAKMALSIDSDREHFEELAKKEGKESAYSAAVAYFFKLIHK